MKKILLFLGIGAIVLSYVFNLSNAVDNYGILENNLSIRVLAQQTSTTGSSQDSIFIACFTFEEYSGTLIQCKPNSWTLVEEKAKFWCTGVGTQPCINGNAHRKFDCSGNQTYFKGEWIQSNCD